MTPEQAYEWLAPKLTTEERSVLDVIYEASRAGRRLSEELDRLDTGTSAPGFDGWENGNGEPVGCGVQQARVSLNATLGRK